MSDGEVLIRAEHVSKKFCRSLKRSLWYGAQDVANALLPWKRNGGATHSAGNGEFREPELRNDEFWAVRDVSFEVRRGECLGLIGHNGAGKSTLLKMLNSLIRPDAGRITMKGRVGALIELSAGFNPILTGRENIYNQAALLGFSKRETESRFDAIVDFAEIEEFLDTPVQNYSSGMRVRLGFAIAAQMEPDILLVDEVLAVGDIGFRYKCLNRIAELQRNCAFILVSHSMPQIARVCTQVMHLHNGQVEYEGSSIQQGMKSYYNEFEVGEAQTSGSRKVQITSIRVGEDKEESTTPVKLGFGETMQLELVAKFQPECNVATMQLIIWNQELVPVVDVLSSGVRRFLIHPDESGHCRVRCRLNRLELNTGTFLISVVILAPDGGEVFLRMDRAVILKVTSNSGSACSITKEAEWAIV